MPDIILKGCTPEPLMSYLKALGVLRLVAEDREHGDPDARGFWRNDQFVLRSRFDAQGIEDFFLDHYCPTPIVVPWSGGDFFAVNWSPGAVRRKKTPTAAAVIESFLTTASARLEGYRTALTACKMALESCGIDTASTEDSDALKGRQAEFKKLKWQFIETLRSTCPHLHTLEWIDTAAVTGADVFAPLLGSGGGSDGNTHFSDNFMQNLWDALPAFDSQRQGAPGAAPQSDDSRAGLRESLFREAGTYRVVKRTSSLFDAGAVGGPNATQGMERESLSNPWDVIIGLEGTLCFATAAVRRLGSQSGIAAAFPFQFQASPASRDGLADKESAGKEIWLPLWPRPCTIGEVLSLVKEGRAEAGSRPVRSGIDMARAIATLGIDRGVSSFHRYALVKGRVGGENYNTAASLGRFTVTERPHAELLREIDPWLDRFRRACSGDAAPARFTSALRTIDSAVFDFCLYGGSANFQTILIALGAAERRLATGGRFREEKYLRPLSGLSSAWVDAAKAPDNGEFDIALALASIDDPTQTIGPLRSNLESVTVWRNADENLDAKWAEKERAVVWNAADLAANLAAVLDRRVMDGSRKGCADLPLASAFTASPTGIAAFLRGELDDRKIEDLLWGLMLLDLGPVRSADSQSGFAAERPSTALPSLYCLLKLLFLPRPLVAFRGSNGVTRWRLAKAREDGIRIRPEPAILWLLRAGRVGEAAAIAMRRLRSSGLNPLPHRRSGGPSRDGEWREVHFAAREGQRLAASLLIPIHPSAANSLVQQATRASKIDASLPPTTFSAAE